MRLFSFFIFISISSFLVLSSVARGDVDVTSERLLDALEQRNPPEGQVHVSSSVTMVELSTAIGTRFNAYVAGPEEASKAILLLHDRWGLDQWMKAQVEAFARRGYRALAIDMFDGRASTDPELADEILAAADPVAARVNMLAGIDHLHTPGRRIAVMGWGFGGEIAYEGALAASNRLAAVVAWYAPLYRNAAETRIVTVPLMGIFALGDESLPEEEVLRYEAMTRKSRYTFRASIHEADYGFADPRYPSFDPQVTARAWEDIDRFLAAHVED